MTNPIEIDSLAVVSHNSVPVVTTELLAELYGTERQRLTNNFNRNKDRFVEGKHFFLLEGDELRDLKSKNSLRVSVKIAHNVRSLILWTERGAARHAKMLETDQAWEVFEKLEDCYFSFKSNITATSSPIPFPEELRFIVNINANGATKIEPLSSDMLVGKVDQILSGLRERGWIVIRRETLVERLSIW